MCNASRTHLFCGKSKCTLPSHLVLHVCDNTISEKKEVGGWLWKERQSHGERANRGESEVWREERDIKHLVLFAQLWSRCSPCRCMALSPVVATFPPAPLMHNSQSYLVQLHQAPLMHGFSLTFSNFLRLLWTSWSLRSSSPLSCNARMAAFDKTAPFFSFASSFDSCLAAAAAHSFCTRKYKRFGMILWQDCHILLSRQNLEFLLRNSRETTPMATQKGLEEKFRNEKWQYF